MLGVYNGESVMWKYIKLSCELHYLQAGMS
jgi:hypothetical protein